MNMTGKKARKQSGHNRFQLHFSQHAHKSMAKRKAMGWGKKGKLPSPA